MGWGVLDDVFARRSLIQRIRRGSGWVGGWVGGGLEAGRCDGSHSGCGMGGMTVGASG
jgi:hypothetical protein